MKIKKNNLKFSIKRKPKKIIKNTIKRKTKKTIKNKKRFYGGVNAIKNYYNSSSGSPIITRISSDYEVENLFNQTITPCWKQFSTARIKLEFSYDYAPYNYVSRLSSPMYFGKLPQQISSSNLYAPIYVYTETIQMPIPPELLTIYNYIVNTLFKDEWQICLTKSQLCPWSPSLKGHASRSCCGFNAPAIGVILQFYTRSMINNIDITEDQKMVAINTGLNLYSILTGYGNSGVRSPYSWNANCNDPNFFKFDLKEGSNIITFYGRRPNPGCSTYHHFIVYKQYDYCIIIDSWAGTGGHRGEWARIMKTADIKNILREISITNSLEDTNQLLNEYFIVPHGIDDIKYPNNIDTNKQQELLSVGANNLSDLENGILSQLQDISKQNLFFKLYGGRKS